MKKRVTIILLVFSIINMYIFPALAVDVDDVSENHWAYQSVVELVERGYMSLQEDNNFAGEKEVTRYELAEIIARILNNIEQGHIAAGEGDVVTLKNLATEFRTELVEVIKETEDLEEKVEAYQNKYEVFGEDLIIAHDKINNLEYEVDSLLNSLREEAANIKRLESKVNELESKNEGLENRMNNLEREIRRTGTQEEIDRLNRRFFWLTSGGAIVSLLLLLN